MSKNLDIQSWHEVPSIAHFCSLFREAFKLFEFDIQDLEESLLLHGAEDNDEDLVLQLVISLLQGCLPSFKKRINKENFNKYLRQFLQTKREEFEEEGFAYSFENPFEQNTLETDFIDLDLRDKVRVLHHLCELRLDAADVGERVKNLDGSSLRVDPLGCDSEGSILWYFYGTRLYKEEKNNLVDKPDKKRKKKSKKSKKKRRKESRESIESLDSHVTSEEEKESSWSVICSTVQDWENLVASYKQSDKREDRKLYKLLQDCFLPEIREMFVEKKREERKKMQQQLSRRSSSRVEVLKKQQEERDRQLALQLAQETKKAKKEERDKRGRKRGRKRKLKGSDEDDEDDDDEEEDGNEQEDEEDIQGDREERAKQREMMKEMRARREAEKAVESKFREEVQQQRAKVKEKEDETKSAKRNKKEVSRKPRKPVRYDTDSDDTVPDVSSEASSRDQSPDVSEADSDDVYKPPKEYKSNSSSKTNFSNALIRAGTKSTKDSSLVLEKEKQKSIKEILNEKPVVRKSPGLLLQTAGKGLLNKPKESMKENGEIETSISRPSSGISFGLWGGHLPVEPSLISSNMSSSYDDKPSSVLTKDKKEESSKKVFSNWGGDFFKKNLDFRANTNRILEKLSKSSTDVNSSSAANGNGFS